MGTPIAQIDATYGHLVPDSEPTMFEPRAKGNMGGRDSVSREANSEWMSEPHASE